MGYIIADVKHVSKICTLVYSLRKLLVAYFLAHVKHVSKKKGGEKLK